MQTRHGQITDIHETKLKIRVPKKHAVCLNDFIKKIITRYNNAERNVETPLPLVCDVLLQNVSNRIL